MNVFGTNAKHQSIVYPPVADLKIELSWYALTDIGSRRETNEDSLVTVAPLFAVADGMGGHAAGDVASSKVVARLAEIAESGNISRELINESLKLAVNDIDEVVGPDEAGAGTTVTGITFGDDQQAPVWDVFNIGDSRVYQCFRGSLTQITSDHSIVQHLIDIGTITPEEAEVHPHANVITRAVGFNEEPIPDYVQLAIIPGQRLLICSDGLTKELTDVGLQHFLTTSSTAEEAAKVMVEQALNNSGRDNVTVIVVDVHSVGDDADTTELLIADDSLADDNFADGRSAAEDN